MCMNLNAKFVLQNVSVLLFFFIESMLHMKPFKFSQIIRSDPFRLLSQVS